jgi:hypothetical protein
MCCKQLCRRPEKLQKSCWSQSEKKEKSHKRKDFVFVVFVFETRSHCVAQSGLILAINFCLGLLNAGITDVCHHPWLRKSFSLKKPTFL